MDGYNDIAISAPSEGQGVVYIYLGGPRRLSTKPYQKILAPVAPSTQPSLFGTSISRGVDVDGNSFKDIAIGSPLDDAVYVYKTYPAYKVFGAIFSRQNRLVAATDENLELQVCLKFNGRNSKMIGEFRASSKDTSFTKFS
jgi:hypothetical protein